MITRCELKIDIDAKELGRIASKLNSSEAQQFWFSFVDSFKEDNALDEYANALSDSLGGKRKRIFEALYHAMKYHEHFETGTPTPKEG